MHVANPWKSYRQIATQTAPPGQLVLMLYEGILRYLERSLPGFTCPDPAQANMLIHNNLQRAQEIVRELSLALDLEKGGQFAHTLRRLYDYFDRRLTESNLRKNRQGVDEVIRHVTILRDAWATMLNNQAADNQATPPPSESSGALATA